MATILVVNGNRTWDDAFSGHRVIYRRLQDVGWVLRAGGLWVVGRDDAHQVDAVFWRVGAVRVHPSHRSVLDLIRHAGIPCVNKPDALLRCMDRLSMLAELKAAGLPIVPFDAAVGDGLIRKHGVALPFVLKVGSHHGGYGKVRVTDEAQWGETADLVSAADDYATAEPWIPHVRDVRCLAVGGQLWAMERRGRSWRANVDTVVARVIEPPPALAELTVRACGHLGVDVIALDALEREDGTFVVLESNETPGFAGFPEVVRDAAASLLLRML